MRNCTLLAMMCLALGVIGCESPVSRPQGAIIGEQTLSIRDLAARLSLRIEEQSDALAILKNNSNTVLIFTGIGGRIFVNGTAIGPVGSVDRVGTDVYVPEVIVGQIRSHLASEAPRVSVTPGRGQLVVIDPGHGGHDPGAIAVNGVYEKDITLSVASKVAGLLRGRGYRIVMTRQDDRFIELEDRAALANRLGADLFVSIHADSAPDPGIQGSTAYVAEAASVGAMRAARYVSTAIDTTGINSRGIRRADYRVLVQTRCPAVLVELGYLSNYSEAARLQSATVQNRLAAAIANGVADYFD
jgi:N-acetylmuramoyl-L-alanine amidase